MHRQDMQAGIMMAFFLCGLAFAHEATAEDAVSATRRAAASAAEEEAAIAREHAESARKFAERAEQRATAAEALAERARRRSTATRPAEEERELVELQAQETDRGLVLTLGDVLFAPDQAELTEDAMRKLYPLVTLLKEQPKRTIRIAGYTDSQGPESYNLDLSQRRADAVRDFLIEHGIAANRIVARGYGEADPVASNATVSGRRENRRVEVLVPRAGARVTTRAR